MIDPWCCSPTGLEALMKNIIGYQQAQLMRCNGTAILSKWHEICFIRMCKDQQPNPKGMMRQVSLEILLFIQMCVIRLMISFSGLSGVIISIDSTIIKTSGDLKVFPQDILVKWWNLAVDSFHMPFHTVGKGFLPWNIKHDTTFIEPSEYTCVIPLSVYSTLKNNRS